MKYNESRYKYSGEELADAFQLGFEEGEYEAEKSKRINVFQNHITENKDYFEVNGYKIAKDNFGEPICPNIIKNPKINTSKEYAQAWEYIINDKSISMDGNYQGFELFRKVYPWITLSEEEAKNNKIYPNKVWMYNTVGAIEEGIFRGIKIPSNEELLFVLNSIPGNILEKSKLLHIPLIGYIDTDNDFKNPLLGDSAILLSCSHFKNAGERCSQLNCKDNDVIGKWLDCGHGAIVRPFFNY